MLRWDRAISHGSPWLTASCSCSCCCCSVWPCSTTTSRARDLPSASAAEIVTGTDHFQFSLFTGSAYLDLSAASIFRLSIVYCRLRSITSIICIYFTAFSSACFFSAIASSFQAFASFKASSVFFLSCAIASSARASTSFTASSIF